MRDPASPNLAPLHSLARRLPAALLASGAAIALIAAPTGGVAQTVLPGVEVTAPAPKKQARASQPQRAAQSQAGAARRAPRAPSRAAAAVRAAPRLAPAGPSEQPAIPVLTNGPTGVQGYTATNVTAGTKTNTPLVEVPQTISVVTRQNLDDRNVQNLTEALAYTPGASVGIAGFDPRYDDVYLRGFDTIYNGVYRDGLRDLNAANAGAVFRNEPYGLDAATIIEGPAGATYGYGSPGGIVDLTSKRPVFTRFGEVQFQAGNFNRVQGNFDIGGPVEGSDGKAAYRLTSVFRDANTFPNGRDDRIDIAPAFTYQPSAATSFTLLTGYDKTRVPGSTGFFNLPNFTVSDIPTGDPAYNKLVNDQWRVGYAFEHKFSNDLIVRQNMRYAALDMNWRYSQVDFINPGGLSATRTSGLLYEGQSTILLDNQVEGHFLLGPTQHTVLAGLDYANAKFSVRSGFNFGTAPALSFNPYNLGQQYFPDPALSTALDYQQHQDQLGEYLQDQIRFGNATLTLSGRHDSVNTTTDNTAPATSTPQTDDAFTGRVGLNYQILPGIYPYASYATTFSPNLATNAAGQAIPAQRGDQKEAGLKVSVPQTNLQLAAAYFDIRESSVQRADPANPGFSLSTGAVTSRGFEVSAVDNIAPGTNLTASVTHFDLRFADSLVAASGNQVSGIPGTTAKAFITYRLPFVGPVGGLTLGGGVRYLGFSFADDPNTAINKPVTFFDAVAGYDFSVLNPTLKGVRAQVNASNVFNTYSTTCQSGYCYRRAPLQIIGSLVYRW